MNKKFKSAIFAIVAQCCLLNSEALDDKADSLQAVPPNQLIRVDGMFAPFGVNPTEQGSSPQGVLVPIRPDETIRPHTLRYEAPPQPWREYSF